MELRLEIKLASVEELATVAKALSGLQVSEGTPAPKFNRAAPVDKVAEAFDSFKKENGTESAGDDEMIDVPSPYTAHPSEVKAAPVTEAKPKALTAAEKKAAKKAQDDAERAERVQRLKDNMEKERVTANDALDKSVAQRESNFHAGQTANTALTQESNEAIVEEIKQLGDKLMAFPGVPLESKQKLTGDILTKLGVSGVRPTQLQQPQLGQFRDMYKAAVNATVNPVMGGLV